MNCGLCLKDKPLRKSHIIPEFMYGALYDDKHRYHVLSTRPEKASRREQKGHRERLLCGDCEQVLGRYEQYGSQVLNVGTPEFAVRYEQGGMHISGIDYAKFRLFQLSILWRAGASSAAYFRAVDLGPRHHEILREQLALGEPGPPDRYPCLMWGLTMEPGVIPGVMAPPSMRRVHGQHAYQFVFPGSMWVFFVSSLPLSRDLSRYSLQLDGTLDMGVKAVTDLQFLNEFMYKANAMGRLPELE